MIGQIYERPRNFNHLDFINLEDDVVIDNVAYPALASMIETTYDSKYISLFHSWFNDNATYANLATIYTKYDGEFVISPNVIATGGTVRILNNTSSGYVLEQTISREDGNKTNDYFGIDIEIMGDFMIVYARVDTSDVVNLGSLHIYKKIEGVYVFQNMMDTPINQGSAVFTSSGNILYMAISDKIYVFIMDEVTSVLTNFFTIDKPSDAKNWGASEEKLKSYGDILVVGDGVGATNQKVYIYKIDINAKSLDLTQTIGNPMGTAVDDNFGAILDFDGDRIAIKTWYDVNAPAYRGTIYIYKLAVGNFILEDVIYNQETAEYGMYIGTEIMKLIGESIIFNTTGSPNGLLVWSRNTQGSWEQVDKLVDVVTGGFGTNTSRFVDVSNNEANIVCTGDDTNGSNYGAILTLNLAQKAQYTIPAHTHADSKLRYFIQGK